MPARTTAPPASETRDVLRLAPPVALWWVWLAFVAANVVDFAVQGLSSARFGAVVSAILLFVTSLAYTLALRPRVIADAAGLTVVNPFRTHRVPWRAIESVDTGEWVRIRYTVPGAATDTLPDGASDGASCGSAGDSDGASDGASDGDSDGAGTRTLHCWALYVSARARRKNARVTPGPRPAWGFAAGFGRASKAAAAVGGNAADGGSRLPEEARYLASLPIAKAMASRLDTRAARERARQGRQRRQGSQQPDRADQATAAWDWPSVAAVVITAIVLLVVALV
jgi:hypothetical protein